MKLLGNIFKRLTYSIGITHIARWVLLTLLLFRMNQIKQWRCIEHVQDYFQDVTTHIFTLAWNILEQII